MFVDDQVQILVCCEPVDMRKGANGLCGLIRDTLKEEPLSRKLFVFQGKRRDTVKISQALLTVKTFEDARDIIKPHFKPSVLKNGRVIYRAKDGGVVFDEATAISVKEVTEAATLLALSLADERFRGKALVVEGSSEFKLQVARLSALEGIMSIRFADPVL